MNNLDLDNLIKLGRSITIDDCSLSSYTLLGYKYNLDNYLLFDKSILSTRVIPSNCINFFVKYDKVVGIFQKTDIVDYIVFRSLITKEFTSLVINRSIPYGLSSFKDFEYGKPIIIVEGLKDRDCLVGSGVYPYVIAMQSSALTSTNIQILSTLTDKILLLYDNDSRGLEMRKRDKRLLQKQKISVSILNHPNGIKDSGEIIDSLYIGDSFKSDFLVDYYRSLINDYNRV